MSGGKLRARWLQRAWRRSGLLRRHGFTLVELLVVIAILGILVSLLLPAAQASREAARKTECKNHLKQMGTAFLNHENAQKFLPSSGWGNKWVGDPDGGFGATQPGGWAYSILPYMEFQALFDAGPRLVELRSLNELVDGGGGDGNELSEQHFLRLVTTPVAMFNCPTKRAADLYPMHPDHKQLAVNVPSCWAANDCRVPRGDYLANSGNGSAGDQAGPNLTWSQPLYPRRKASRAQNGVTFACSEVKLANIIDGASKTILLGEKYQEPATYETGQSGYDNQCVFSGHDSDNNGYTGSDSRVLRPLPDHSSSSKEPHHFGSAHAEGLHVAYCDGSVHFVDFDIDGRIWYGYGGRDDEDRPPRETD